jgi:hypothetical protein
MKNFRGFALGLVLGVGIALSGLAFAQTDQTKKTNSCTMACCGDSCASMKDAKNASDKHSCCCCGGESCSTEMKEMHLKNTTEKNKQ